MQTPTPSFDTVREVTETSHEKLPPMPKVTAFMFHHNFYPKPKLDIKGTEISEETKQKLHTLQQNYGDILNKHSSDIGLTHLEETIIDTDQN